MERLLRDEQDSSLSNLFKFLINLKRRERCSKIERCSDQEQLFAATIYLK